MHRTKNNVNYNKLKITLLCLNTVNALMLLYYIQHLNNQY